MGAVSFTLDEHLLDAILTHQNFDVFVETGTFNGDTLALIKNRFPNIHSIELSEALYQKAQNRFQNSDHIKLWCGDSALQLQDIQRTLNSEQKVFYWLDAHWCCADATAGDASQCPLLEELKAIQYLNDQSVIAIDDARLFLAPPPKPHIIEHWPAFSEILSTLQQLNARHKLMVINDIILFYPPELDAVVQSYAINFGVDWLVTMHKAKETAHWMQMALEKEAMIAQLKEECARRDAVIGMFKLHQFHKVKQKIRRLFHR